MWQFDGHNIVMMNGRCDCGKYLVRSHHKWGLTKCEKLKQDVGGGTMRSSNATHHHVMCGNLIELFSKLISTSVFWWWWLNKLDVLLIFYFKNFSLSHVWWKMPRRKNCTRFWVNTWKKTVIGVEYSSSLSSSFITHIKLRIFWFHQSWHIFKVKAISLELILRYLSICENGK